MTLKKLIRIKLAIIALALFIGSSVLTEIANAQTYPPLPNWNYNYMVIARWTVQTQAGVLVWEETNNRTQKQIGQISTPIQLTSAATYRTAIAGLYWYTGSCCYPMNAYMWIDWNANGSFNDAGELFFNYNFRSGTEAQIGTASLPWVSFTVPTSAQGKTFRARVCAQYAYYGYPPVTGTASYYGDGGDLLLTVPKPPADAGTTAITTPSGAFSKGNQNITVRIKNYKPEPLTTCRIVWRIDEGLGTESSNTYSWSGSLAQNNETDVVVGTYNFSQNRTYTLDAFTEFPNDLNDQNPANDRGAVRRFVAPALSPGTYYIGAYGGSSNTFATVNDLTDYLSLAGLLGDGVLEVVFPTQNPGPAIFDLGSTPIIIGSYPSVGTNTVQFRSLSNDPDDVIIQFLADGTNPYLMSLNSVSNTSIKGLTFDVSGGTTHGGIINLDNCDGVVIENCIFENVENALEDNNCTSINLTNSYDVKINYNEFWNGSVGINESGFCPRKFEITYNLFEDVTWKCIQLYGISSGTPCTENIVKIDTNKFTGNNYYANYGISSTNGTEITRNTFTGFLGSSPSDAVIYVTNTDPTNFTGETVIDKCYLTSSITDIHGIYADGIPDLSITNSRVTVNDVPGGGNAVNSVTIYNSGSSSTPVYIQKNQFAYGTTADLMTTFPSVNDNCIYLDNSNARVYYNDIDLNSGGGNIYSILTTNNSQGYIANNQIASVDALCVFLDNSQMGVYYNSIANQNNSSATLVINGGANIVRRNIVQNEGLGPAIVVSTAGGNTLDENNYFSKNYSPSVEIGNWEGISCADSTAWWAASGQDVNSSFIEIEFFNFAQFNLGLNTFSEELVFDDPIDFGDPALDAEIQNIDYLGQTRYSYFMGSENIVPEVFITGQPVGVMDCIGETGYFLGTTAYVTRGVQARYEWFKDGFSLKDLYENPTDDWAEKASIYLDSLPFADTAAPGLNFAMEGTYRCFVRGSGAEPKWTNSVLVNALSDAVITREPEDVRVDDGGTAVIEVEAHIVADEGVDDPLYQPEVQWYFANASRDSVKNDLHVDGHFSGAQSTILTIRNIDQGLIDGDLQDGLFVELKGSCNSLTSQTVFVKLLPTPYINEDPVNTSACQGTVATFEVDATSSDPDATLEYAWRKDGTIIPGAITPTLTLTAVTAADAGSYDCVVTVVPGGKSVTSAPATLTIVAPVTITLQPTAQNVAEGNPFTLLLTATGEAPITYQWAKDGTDIPGATQTTYSVTSASMTNAGVYTCKVTNVCGTVTSNPATVTVTTGGIVDVPDYTKDGFALTNNEPNPFTDNSRFGFFAPKASYVRLAITDVFGREVAVLVDNTVETGWNYLDINASELQLSSGVYYYTLTSNNDSITKKMVVVR